MAIHSGEVVRVQVGCSSCRMLSALATCVGKNWSLKVAGCSFVELLGISSRVAQAAASTANDSHRRFASVDLKKKQLRQRPLRNSAKVWQAVK